MGPSRTWRCRYDLRWKFEGPVDNICQKRSTTYKTISARITTAQDILAPLPTSGGETDSEELFKVASIISTRTV